MTTVPPSDPRSGDDDPTGVRALLSSLPDPGPMPDDLVARIAAALDAESAARTVAPAAEPATEGDEPWAEVVPLAGARRASSSPRRRSWRPLAAAAAGIAILGGGGAFLSTHLPRTASGVSAALGATSTTTGRSATSPAPTTVGAPVQIRLSGRDVKAAQLAAYGRSLLASTWDPATPHTVEQPGVGPLGTPDGVKECMAAIDARPGDRVAAEIGRLDGKPAVIIATLEGAKVRTYAASVPCALGSGRLLAGPVAAAR